MSQVNNNYTTLSNITCDYYNTCLRRIVILVAMAMMFDSLDNDNVLAGWHVDCRGDERGVASLLRVGGAFSLHDEHSDGLRASCVVQTLNHHLKDVGEGGHQQGQLQGGKVVNS